MAESGQWKSRFPVARIKKIMQADEDVGKVAQVTPVAICTFPSHVVCVLWFVDCVWWCCWCCLCGLSAGLIVAKALELFMDRFIKAVADETKARGARRVTPSHL
jgi:Dr1-associated corepressor